jgi:hypothetical protein
MCPLPIALCFLIQVPAESPVRLYPIDETGRDSAFRSYVRKLRSAVNARNTAALRKLVDDEVVVGPARDDKGWDKFVAKWGPDDRSNPRMWNALADLLSLGFTREHPSLFVSPYLVWRFPRDLSITSHLVVIRDKVALREAPSLRAPVAATLSFDVVRRLSEPEGDDELVQWVRVETLDGKTGYLNTRDVMSPMMPRAQFGLSRGRWLMTALEEPEVRSVP